MIAHSFTRGDVGEIVWLQLEKVRPAVVVARVEPSQVEVVRLTTQDRYREGRDRPRFPTAALTRVNFLLNLETRTYDDDLVVAHAGWVDVAGLGVILDNIWLPAKTRLGLIQATLPEGS